MRETFGYWEFQRRNEPMITGHGTHGYVIKKHIHIKIVRYASVV